MVNLDTYQRGPRFVPIIWTFMYLTGFTTVFSIKYMSTWLFCDWGKRIKAAEAMAIQLLPMSGEYGQPCQKFPSGYKLKFKGPHDDCLLRGLKYPLAFSHRILETGIF